MTTTSTSPSTSPVSSPFPPVVTPDQLAALRGADRSLRLVDVRTPAEFNAVHIRGAYNVPLDRLGEHAAEIQAVRAPVVLVCRSGQRARQAETALKAGGLQQLHVLDGGVAAWEAAGHPVERGRAHVSIERQVRMVAGALAGIGGLLALTVSSWFALLPLAIGSGLFISGATDTCTMALVLARLPYNRTASCDVATMVRALAAGTEAPRG